MSDPYKQIQPELFDFSDTAEDVLELFPGVWKALELLISPIVEDRVRGYYKIIELNAHRFSPIVAYILATCLDDEDIDFRLKITNTVGELLSSDEEGRVTPIEVKRQLKYYLSKMRQRKIFALLQVADYEPSSQSSVAALLKACSYAGNSLGDIFSNHKLPIAIRTQAIKLSGMVGFLETIPRLEKLMERLETRMNGQRKMSFAPAKDPMEKNLLPTINSALELLKSP
jgi:hypothetical protein